MRCTANSWPGGLQGYKGDTGIQGPPGGRGSLVSAEAKNNFMCDQMAGHVIIALPYLSGF